MSDESLNLELEQISVKDFRKALRIALKEQDRDTRHACAEACLVEEANQNYIVHKAFHDICMNCNSGILMKI